MVTRVLVSLLAVLCLHFVTEGARISSCDSRRKWVEGYDNLYKNCFVKRASTVTWSVVSKNGSRLYLGTCYGPSNCTSRYSSSSVSVYHYGSSPGIRIYNIDSRFAGELTCQETLTNGTVLTDTCPLNLARVSFRSEHHIDCYENTSCYVYCYHSRYTPSTVTWTLTTISGKTLDLGTCTGINRCTSPHNPDITLRRTRAYRSSAYFKNINRSKGGQLFCSYTYKGIKEEDNATLNVYNPATVSNCRANLYPQNWSTILSCDISNVFSSSGDYDFAVQEDFKVLQNGRLTTTNSYVFDGRLSYRDMVTPYTNSTANMVYYRGRLFYSWPLSPTQGLYTGFTVYIYYGHNQNKRDDVDYTLNVTAPSQPTHNCSELTSIPETGVVACVCTAHSLGSPPGRLLWLLGNITIATGDYGVNQLKFPSNKGSSGMMVTCQLDWIQPIRAAFTGHVASELRNSAQTQATSDDFKWTAVGLGVALGVVVIVFVVVMIILYRRGSLTKEKGSTQIESNTAVTEDSHDYTSLQFTKVAKNKRRGGKQGVTCPSAVYQGDDDVRVYENTAVEGQGGHM